MNAPWSEPFNRFAGIYEEAKRAQPKDPNAMTLSTVSATGRPSSRIVLLKDFDQHGFVFFTNYKSKKGLELNEQRVAALNFYWPAIEQQVRIEGDVEHVSSVESDKYFATRPRESQLGAWASTQSEALADRADLEKRLEALEREYENIPVPRPPHWGGFRVTPVLFEFWQAHPHRLHWREQYEKKGNGWARGWLNP